MTASQLLKQARASYQVSTVFRFPYVHLIVADEAFATRSDEQREWEFAAKLKTSISEIRSAASNALFVVRLLTPEEMSSEYGSSPAERGHHWLGSLAAEAISEASPTDAVEEKVKAAHFYGYKGGQARSTILALVASSLADEGWKVLTVDSDLEAPSLDIIFGRSVRPLAGTLLGVSQGVTGFSPERVRLSSDRQGFIDLLACRPRRPEYDIDAVALALRSALDATIIEKSARRIRDEAARGGYDIILVDHRAGLSPITLPWLRSLPGPVVISARLDDQWQPARTFLRAVLKEYPSNPGLFVSWKPDEEDPASFRERNGAQIDSLLDMLADALTDTNDGEGELSSVELEDHWILLPYDSAFRAARSARAALASCGYKRGMPRNSARTDSGQTNLI